MTSCFQEGTTCGRGKKELYKTAVGVFARKGYHDATVDEIAQTMGIAKGTIYYRFKNKEELYFALIKEGINVLCNSVSSEINKVSEPKEKLKKLISSQLEFFNNNSDVTFIFLRELYGNLLGRDTLKDMINEYYKVVSSVLMEGKEKNVFHFTSLETTTSAVFGMIAVTGLHYLNIYGNIPLKEAIPSLEQLVLNGL